MEVNSVGPVASPSVRFSYTEHAQKLADANQAARLDKPTGTKGDENVDAPNVSTSVTYSPALYAQAAHFQLLSQAGAFNVAHPPTNATAPKNSVEKVSSVDGASVGKLK